MRTPMWEMMTGSKQHGQEKVGPETWALASVNADAEGQGSGEEVIKAVERQAESGS